MKIPDQIEELITHLSSFQGVGEKTATRYTLSMLNWDRARIEEFARSIRGLLEVGRCKKCGFLAVDEECKLCEQALNTKAEHLCVIESLTDCLAIQKSQTFHGHYHVLNGVLNPLMGIGPKELGVEKLLDRVVSNDYKEVILALNSSVEGDATCSYIKEVLPPKTKVERIGFGLPMGGSLEYVDSMTITKALENRRQL